MHPVNLSVTLSASAVTYPAPWASEDIGNTGRTDENTTINSGTFSMQAGGAQVGVSDALRFLYQPLAGDSTVIARIDSESSLRILAGRES